MSPKHINPQPTPKKHQKQSVNRFIRCLAAQRNNKMKINTFALGRTQKSAAKTERSDMFGDDKKSKRKFPFGAETRKEMIQFI